MNNKITKRLLSFILILFFIFVGFLFLQNRTQVQPFLNKLLQEQFDNRYKTKVRAVDDYLITIIESSCSFGDSRDSCKWDAKKTPLIVIQDIKSNKLLSMYKIGFMNNSKTKLDTGNNIWLVDVKYKNDGFKDFVFLTEWGISYGGSSGLKGMAMFQKINNELIPVNNYPSVNNYPGAVSQEKNMTLTEIQSGKAYLFPIIVDSYSTFYQDLNKDGKTDLLFARWEWILGKESHYDPRPWYLRVYELNNGQFEIAKWWNKGEEYKTEENIGYEKTDETKLLNIFDSVYKSSSCKNLSEDEAVTIVKNLPEVKAYLGQEFTSNNNVFVDVDHSTQNLITVHVYEAVKDTITKEHSATFNWYSIDKCTGKVRCSFVIYNQGKKVRVAETNEYPCN